MFFLFRPGIEFRSRACCTSFLPLSCVSSSVPLFKGSAASVVPQWQEVPLLGNPRPWNLIKDKKKRKEPSDCSTGWHKSLCGVLIQTWQPYLSAAQIPDFPLTQEHTLLPQGSELGLPLHAAGHPCCPGPSPQALGAKQVCTCSPCLLPVLLCPSIGIPPAGC